MRLGQRTRETGDFRAVVEEPHVGNTADLELLRELRMRLGVDLHQLPFPGRLGGEFFEDGAEHLARPAPSGPEINQHRHALAAVDDVGLEIGQVVVHRRCNKVRATGPLEYTPG